MDIQFDIILPTFPVKDVPQSAEFYKEKLGFEISSEMGNYYAHVKRGNAVIALYAFSHLQQRSGCQGFTPPSQTRATIFVEGIEELCEDYKAKGVTIIDPPEEVPYGWDMQIADCDGHIIEFVQFRSD